MDFVYSHVVVTKETLADLLFLGRVIIFSLLQQRDYHES